MTPLKLVEEAAELWLHSAEYFSMKSHPAACVATIGVLALLGTIAVQIASHRAFEESPFRRAGFRLALTTVAGTGAGAFLALHDFWGRYVVCSVFSNCDAAEILFLTARQWLPWSLGAIVAAGVGCSVPIRRRSRVTTLSGGSVRP